ncbi:PREDICTED: uncharacterized protein LOC100632861 [Amphimedon queenslandica]|uniref:Uncharacterized protein n=1 Tax=Amphimedon queenslandica TaxID=400682 RepID=A0AAN0I9B6_AMPQE|nr:PREDICTED: uncharacterized protein LOC100632861 [Amphimedon queenslandica]|eukprot:XP_003383077.1 PREDICTED: uncharacterized protein LOC100632861 [Amphimedon queenslandica]
MTSIEASREVNTLVRKWLHGGKESLDLPVSPKVVFWEGKQGIGAGSLPGAKAFQRRESLAVKVKKKLLNARRRKAEREDSLRPSNEVAEMSSEIEEEESKGSIMLKSKKRKSNYEERTAKRKRFLTTDANNNPLKPSINPLTFTDAERHSDATCTSLPVNGGHGELSVKGVGQKTPGKIKNLNKQKRKKRKGKLQKDHRHEC